MRKLINYENNGLNNSDTLILVLHEIYGINRHISDTVEKFRQMGFDAFCPDFTGLSEPFAYDCGLEAYTHFIKNTGFTDAARQTGLLAALAKKAGYRRIILCGYSIGATVAWLCSREQNVDGVICYYGSRIRDYAGINPACPALLIFPSHEESYDVKSFAASISKPGVQVITAEGRHGFADRYSPNYNEASCLQAEELVTFFIQNRLGISK